MPSLIRQRLPPKQSEPDSLQLLRQPHVMRLDVEDFWSTLSISLNRNKHERGRGFGLSWQFASVDPEYLRAHIPICSLPGNANIDMAIDWMTVKSGAERLVIIHYVESGPDGKLLVKAGLIATSTFIIAKLRLIGDQIIMAHADRVAQAYRNDRSDHLLLML